MNNVSYSGQNEQFIKRITNEDGLLLSHGISPIKIPVTAKAGLIYKVTFDYLCNAPGCSVFSNLYKPGVFDLHHYTKQLEFTTEFKTAEYYIVCDRIPVPQAASLRIWIDSFQKRALIKNVKVTTSLESGFKIPKKLPVYGYNLLSEVFKRPIIAMVYEDRLRSPVATKLYKEICKDARATVKVFDDPTVSIHRIINEIGAIPDYVYVGYGRGKSSLFENYDVIKCNGVKIITQVGDAQCFQKTSQWARITTHIIGHMKSNWWGYEQLNAKMPHIKHIYIPWGLDLNYYKDRKLKRDVDVAMMCSVGSSWKYHKNRREMFEVIKGLDINKITSKFYGKKYVDRLNRSKIFIVDSSGRKALVQKYLEGAACGCLLMGELPQDDNNLFEDGVSFVCATPENLSSKIMYYLKHNRERAKIAAEGKFRVMKHHNVKNSATAFINAVLEDYNG